MFREDAINSVERIGKRAAGALWPLVRTQVVARLSAMPERDLRDLVAQVAVEADHLRGYLR